MNRAALLSVLLTVWLILVGNLAQAQNLYRTKNVLRFKTGPMAKVGSALAQLQEEHAAALKQGLRATFTPRNPLMRVSGGWISIDAAASGDAHALRADLEALGLQQTGIFGHIVSGLFPISAIGSMAALSSLQFARPAYMTTHVGSVESEGDASMQSDDARATFGVDGSGVTVGILSDSYDCLHALDPMTPGADADVANGDLPAGIVVLQDITDPDCSDEGRAMMQLIADVAPGATQAFRTAFLGMADFALGIQELAGCPSGSEIDCTPDPNVAANVIVDDIIYFAEPMFQDGIIAQAIDTVKRAGVAYFSSAGNNGRDSYESSFTPSGIPIGPDAVSAHDFDPGPGVDTCQSIIVPMGTTFISFQWQEPFFSVSGMPGSASDLDLFVFAEPTCDNLLFAGDDMNIGADPVEVLGFSNPGPPVTIGLAIGKFNPAFPSPDPTPNPGLMKYVVFAPTGFSIVDFPTFSSTIYGHPNAAGAVAVGAAFWRDTPEFGAHPPALEPFSSAGPTPIFFTTDGTPTSELRDKPEIVAPDGANTTFFGADIDSDSFPNFFGTSAAAPHAAGVAALIKQLDPSLTPDALYSVLETTAIDMNGPGFDFDTGFGFIQADTSLAKVRADPKDPGHPYVDVNNDGRFTDGIDVPLSNGEIQDGRFDTRISEGGYDAASGCDTGNCGLVIPASAGPISVEKFDYRADGNLRVDTDLNGTGTQVSTLSAGGGLIAQGATVTNTDLNAGKMRLNATGGTLDVSGATIRGGRQITLSTENISGAMLDILAVGAKIEITTPNASPFAQLLSSGSIDITNAMMTDADGASTITLDAGKDITCTGSMLDADRVTVSAGGMAVDCPESPEPLED